MKSNKSLILTILAVILTITSCTQKPVDYNSNDLIGKWKRSVISSSGDSGYDCYRYDIGGNGVTWDTSDDVSEDEAQAFEWTLRKDQLLIVHIGELGEKIPKTYTINRLTASELSYKDAYGSQFTFTKFKGQP